MLHIVKSPFSLSHYICLCETSTLTRNTEKSALCVIQSWQSETMKREEREVNYERTDRLGSWHGRKLWFHRGRAENRFGVNLHFKLARHPACDARNLLICTLLLSSVSPLYLISSLSSFFTIFLIYYSFSMSVFCLLQIGLVFQFVLFFISSCTILSASLL